MTGPTPLLQTPALGQGVNQAFEDGLALGFILSKANHDNIGDLLKFYEKVRKQRATDMQLVSRAFIRKGLSEDERPTVRGKKLQLVGSGGREWLDYVWGWDVYDQVKTEYAEAYGK